MIGRLLRSSTAYQLKRKHKVDVLNYVKFIYYIHRYSIKNISWTQIIIYLSHLKNMSVLGNNSNAMMSFGQSRQRLITDFLIYKTPESRHISIYRNYRRIQFVSLNHRCFIHAYNSSENLKIYPWSNYIYNIFEIQVINILYPMLLK